MLISMQRPEATSVAGFRTWQALGRQVRRGERGLSILAPMLSRRDGDDERLLAGFRWVSVFDVSQTEGEPLPSPVRLLEGEGPLALRSSLRRAAEALGFGVVEEPLSPGVNGECRWASSTIAVEEANPPLQQAKTIAHELGHALLHRHEPTGRAPRSRPKPSPTWSWPPTGPTPPLQRWPPRLLARAGGDVALAVRRSCDAIQRASAAILDAVGATGPCAVAEAP